MRKYCLIIDITWTTTMGHVLKNYTNGIICSKIYRCPRSHYTERYLLGSLGISALLSLLDICCCLAVETRYYFLFCFWFISEAIPKRILRRGAVNFILFVNQTPSNNIFKLNSESRKVQCLHSPNNSRFSWLFRHFIMPGGRRGTADGIRISSFSRTNSLLKRLSDVVN